MKIPSKIKIGGTIFEVELSENVTDGYKCLQGDIDNLQSKIRLLSTSNKQQIEVTLLHEILHAVFYFLGYLDDYDDERKVDSLAHVLHMIIKDNPEMFAADDSESK